MPRLTNKEKLERQFLDAARKGDSKVVRECLEEGVDVDVRDPRTWPTTNRTALMHAAEQGKLRVVKMLIKAGANLEAKDRGSAYLGEPGRSTALIFALGNGHAKIAEALLDAGADPHVMGGGTSPLVKAAYYLEEPDILIRLLEMDVDPNGRTSNRHTPLTSAVMKNRYAAIKALLAAGADINLPSAVDTPFGLAVMCCPVDTCELLLEAGADPMLKDEDGNTTLMNAVNAGNLPVIKWLLELGVPIDAVRGDGKTALDLATMRGNRKVAQLLKSYQPTK